MFFTAFAVNIATLAATPFSHSGNSTTSQMDELLIKSWSSDIMCKCPPAKPIVSGPSLSAPHHKFISSATSSSSQEIGFSPCVRLQLWMRFALLLCWLDPPAGLIAVWSPRPVATCQRCSSHIHCSAPAASDNIPFVSFSLTAILSCSYYGPDFFSFFVLCIFSCYPSPNCSDDSRQMAGWCRKTYMFMVFTQNAVLSLNKMWNEDTNAKKEKKKEFWQWVLWDLFFSSTLLPESVLPHYSGWAQRDSPRLPGSNERSDSWQSFLQPVWQTLFCSTGPFHWVSAKAGGIMDTSLYEAWCMNNGLFVCFPVHVVHVFHNQARTITLCVFMCVRVFVQHVFVKCDAFLFDALS